jgi:hypothetical protein
MNEKKPVLGYDKFLMMALLKEGPLSLSKLWEKSMLFLSLIWYQQLPDKGQPLMEQLFFRFAHVRSELEDGRAEKVIHGAEAEMGKLIKKGWINLNNDDKYELTPDGLIKAKKYEKDMIKEANMVDTELKPSTTAINTTYLDGLN